jgi:transcription elongation factor Elf1
MKRRAVYTAATCPRCGAELFSSTAPWDVKPGTKAVVDTCMTHGKVVAA